MSINPSIKVYASHLLSWSACIPTLNRFDVLQVNIRCLLAQTRLPKQIIVVDASQDVEQHRCALEKIFAGTGVEFVFHSAVAKSSAVQRNQGLSSVTADIVVFMDDDSLLFPDCAEKFLAVFEADREEKIAGLAIRNISELPPIAASILTHKESPQGTATTIKQKKGGVTENQSLLSFLENYRLWRFFRREVLMQAGDRMFVRYDHRRRRSNRLAPQDLVTLVQTSYLPGYGIVVRANVARKELFNPYLLAYCPFEDLDASYRYGRHGACVQCPDARLMHYEVAGSRITRKQATSLGITNIALFIHTGSEFPLRHRTAFAVYVVRRLIGEILKDLLSRRMNFPQARGVIDAIPRAFGIFRRSLPDAQQWYLEQQREFLKQDKAL